MNPDRPSIESISAVTLAVANMARSFGFYEGIGFRLRYGGPDAGFTSFEVGAGFLNLQLDGENAPIASIWGRVIFHVTDVDELHARLRSRGVVPSSVPTDAPWGERYFHVTDPDGHELSFARPLV
jgi:catechol 2,3-dioxygenase-like lactoylglutathione lyase family enzyme